MTAEITAKSVRIVIDIPDVTNFDWSRAHELWADRFKNANNGFSGRTGNPDGKVLGYCWYKVDPATNKPVESVGHSAEKCRLPMPTIDAPALPDQTIQELEQQVDYLQTQVMRMKTNPGKITADDKECMMTDIHALMDRVKQFKQTAKKQEVQA